MINLCFFEGLFFFFCASVQHISLSQPPSLLAAWQAYVSKVAAGEQTVGTAGQHRSLPCSPSRGAAINPSLREPPRFPSLSLQPTHLLPIIRGSNFISTRVAAHCRQPLQSFLINSRFVPYPSFWTHLSDIPIGAGLRTPRQPSDPNPTKNPTPPSFQETLSIFFFPTCRSPTYGVR